MEEPMIEEGSGENSEVVGENKFDGSFNIEEKESSDFYGFANKPEDICNSNVKIEIDSLVVSESQCIINEEQPNVDSYKKENSIFEDDGEDLPDSFFDDFSNKDFMAGLDIVDDWTEDEEPDKKKIVVTETEYKIKKIDIENVEEKSQSTKTCTGKYRDRDHKRREEDRHKNRKSRERRERRSRDRERDLDRRSSRRRDDKRSRERNRSRDRKNVEKSPKKPEVPEEENKTDDNFEGRRDPEKTKRDIQRDKIRCAKDFEARVLQEQLKVAETGLVPPGEELDVVLEQEKKKFEMEQKEKEAKENEEKKVNDIIISGGKKSSEKRKKSKSGYRKEHRSPEYRPRKRIFSRLGRSRERSYSPRYRQRSRSRRSRSYRRTRSPLHRSRSPLRISRSPIRRSRSPIRRSRSIIRRSRSPIRRSRSTIRHVNRRSPSLDRENAYRRNDDLRIMLRAKRRDKHFDDISPVSERRFSRSPGLNLNMSERELWLRSRDRVKNRIERSPTPQSNISLSDIDRSPHPKRSKKQTFMEEIEWKLKENSNRFDNLTNDTMYSNSPEVPQPVPPPQIFSGQPQMQMNNIPFQQTSQHIPQGMGQFFPPTQSNMMQMNMLGNTPTNNTLNRTDIQHDVPRQVGNNMQPLSVTETTKEVNKLFEEQKISLSDYLSVSAKPIDQTAPANLHRKIRVLSQCQDAIRALSEESKFAGRFIPRIKSPCREKIAESTKKWNSPLRRVQPVRYMFTKPSKTRNHQEHVKNLVNKLLHVCDISNQQNEMLFGSSFYNSSVCDKTAVSVTNSETLELPLNIPKPVPAPKPVPPPISFSIKEQAKSASLQLSSATNKLRNASMQTETLKCQICEIRTARKFKNVGTQTSETSNSDKFTQVQTEDLNKSSVMFTPRGILKNTVVQSISHLTPAQLLNLRQESNSTKDGWHHAIRNDSFPSSSRNPMEISQSFMGNPLNLQNPNNFNQNFDINMQNMLANRLHPINDMQMRNVLENPQGMMMMGGRVNPDRFVDNQNFNNQATGFAVRNMGNFFGLNNMGGRGGPGVPGIHGGPSASGNQGGPGGPGNQGGAGSLEGPGVLGGPGGLGGPGVPGNHGGPGGQGGSGGQGGPGGQGGLGGQGGSIRSNHTGLYFGGPIWRS